MKKMMLITAVLMLAACSWSGIHGGAGVGGGSSGVGAGIKLGTGLSF
jgi:hypothetical protein